MELLEKMKKLAVRQMRASASLYEICCKYERGISKDNDYNKLLVLCIRDRRYHEMIEKYGLTMTKEEDDFWNETIGEIVKGEEES